MMPKGSFAQGKIDIEITCFGQVEDYVLGYLKNNLSEIFKARVYRGKTYDLPDYAYNRERGQYLSSHILDSLAPAKDKNQKILAIIDKDLYVAELNFVFGEADPRKGVCIISVTRLRQSYYGIPEDKDLFLKRALKETVHEIGHLFNLGHCSNSKCVMHFSNSLFDTDKKDYNFCENCRKSLPF
jgi:archaemetzincin